MLIKFILYGFLGLLIEIFFTGINSFLNGDFTLSSHTYIWMFFIYGLAVFLEYIHNFIRDKNILIRGGIWAVLIFSIEFFTGFLLKLIIGKCPWDYTDNSNFTLYGYIRFDYFPFWFLLGLIFEKIHDFIDKEIYINKRTL